jgi:hypothetical protein
MNHRPPVMLFLACIFWRSRCASIASWIARLSAQTAARFFILTVARTIHTTERACWGISWEGVDQAEYLLTSTTRDLPCY